MALNIWVLLACLGLTSPVLSQSVDGSKYNNPTAGPPASYFAAATTVPVAALQSAAAKASEAAKDATYPINSDNGAKRVTIHKDWTNFSEVNNLCFIKSMPLINAFDRRAQLLCGSPIWMWIAMASTTSAR